MKTSERVSSDFTAFHLANEDLAFARSNAVEKSTADILPLAGATASCGLIISVAKQDARWFVICGALALLLVVGLVLRWVVYERWMTSQLRNLVVHAHFEG